MSEVVVVAAEGPDLTSYQYRNSGVHSHPLLPKPCVMWPERMSTARTRPMILLCVTVLLGIVPPLLAWRNRQPQTIVQTALERHEELERLGSRTVLVSFKKGFDLLVHAPEVDAFVSASMARKREYGTTVAHFLESAIGHAQNHGVEHPGIRVMLAGSACAECDVTGCAVGSRSCKLCWTLVPTSAFTL